MDSFVEQFDGYVTSEYTGAEELTIYLEAVDDGVRADVARFFSDLPTGSVVVAEVDWSRERTTELYFEVRERLSWISESGRGLNLGYDVPRGELLVSVATDDPLAEDERQRIAEVLEDLVERVVVVRERADVPD